MLQLNRRFRPRIGEIASSRAGIHASKRAGFTLMEVLLVLVILVILAGLAVPLITNTQKNALIRAARGQVGLFASPLNQFHLDMNRFPTADQGLEALVTAPADAGTKWKGPYMESIPEDPWGQKYQFKSPGDHNKQSFDIWSNGPDGSAGTEDDIGNWSS